VVGLGSYYLARRTLEPIEAAHEAQSRFAADASHELRTPITAMRIENEVTLSDPSLTLNDAKTQLQSNIEELDTLMNLTENLLTMARIGSEQLETEKVTIADTLERAIAKVHAQAEQKKQTIVLHKVPKQSLLAHKDLLRDAFVTLLDNAIKYSPEDSKIEIRTKIEHKSLTIKIIDEGAGIPVDAIPHIFKRFYRADRSRTKKADAKGFGLGLSIAQDNYRSA
jgi:two-component system sensor histidine kinase CiaH